jgi:signal peptidase complex subunit 1
MDYAGQALCEKLYQLIVLVAGLIGFGIGYKEQSFYVTFLWCVAGFVVACVVCVPDWPIYRRHPLHWQPHLPLPGEKDVAGNIVRDTNVHCGTCVCGSQVHGAHCDSHPDFGTEVVADAGSAEEAEQEQPASAPVAAASPASSPSSAKGKSGKKSKQ